MARYRTKVYTTEHDGSLFGDLGGGMENARLDIRFKLKEGETLGDEFLVPYVMNGDASTGTIPKRNVRHKLVPWDEMGDGAYILRMTGLDAVMFDPGSFCPSNMELMEVVSLPMYHGSLPSNPSGHIKYSNKITEEDFMRIYYKGDSLRMRPSKSYEFADGWFDSIPILDKFFYYDSIFGEGIDFTSFDLSKAYSFQMFIPSRIRGGVKTITFGDKAFNNCRSWSMSIRIDSLETINFSPIPLDGDCDFPDEALMFPDTLANLTGYPPKTSQSCDIFQGCPLTRESARIVIDRLLIPKPEGDTVERRIYFSSTTKALLTDEDKAAITAKGWVLDE